MCPSKNLVIVPSHEYLENCVDCVKSMQKFSFTERSELAKHWALMKSLTCIIDMEKIVNQELENIILINFDNMPPASLRSIIHKSKKTEIIGLSIDHSDYFKDLQIEMCQLYERGLSTDQVLVMMVLKYNCSSSFIGECLNNFKFKNSDISIKAIDHVSDILGYIKSKESYEDHR